MKKTPLHDLHVSLNASMVDFGGWDMPINYGSQIDEHHFIRKDAGMFDVSHMTIVDLKGAKVKAFLQKLLANDVGRLKDAGKALYSCMLNENGGVIDDLITYYINDTFYRTVVNASTREKDLAWINKQAEAFAVEVTERDDYAMIAVQGPNARAKAHKAVGEDAEEKLNDMAPFYIRDYSNLSVARTGYTGEDGYEIMVPEKEASALWTRLLEAGVKPCGLGARDTLRLEAGMNLYGSDMDETISPLEAGLNWTVAWEPAERDFRGEGGSIGPAALSVGLCGSSGSHRTSSDAVVNHGGNDRMEMSFRRSPSCRDAPGASIWSVWATCNHSRALSEGVAGRNLMGRVPN